MRVWKSIMLGALVLAAATAEGRAQAHFERRGALLLGDHVEARLAGWYDESDDVMHDLPIAWPRLGHLHVLVFFEVGRRIEVLVLIGAACFDGVLFGHLDNDIRFPDTPTLDKLRRGRQLFRIALFRTAIYPGGDGVDHGLEQLSCEAFARVDLTDLLAFLLRHRLDLRRLPGPLGPVVVTL